MHTILQPLGLFPIVFVTKRNSVSLLTLYYPHLPSLNLKREGSLSSYFHWIPSLRISLFLPVAVLCPCIPFSLENSGTAGSFCLLETFLNSPSLVEGLFGWRFHSWWTALPFRCSNPPSHICAVLWIAPRALCGLHSTLPELQPQLLFLFSVLSVILLLFVFLCFW